MKPSSFSTPQNILDKQKLNDLLVANWTKFLDTKKFMAFVLASIQDHASNFSVYKEQKVEPKPVQIKVSIFKPHTDGFTIWAEFTVYSDEKLHVGTSEINLNLNGDLTHISTFGNTFIEG